LGGKNIYFTILLVAFLYIAHFAVFKILISFLLFKNWRIRIYERVSKLTLEYYFEFIGRRGGN